MPRVRVALSLLLSLTVVCWTALAAAQSAELVAALRDFSRNIGAYIDPVQFDQSDIDSFIDGWPEVSAIFEDGSSSEDESMEEVLTGLSSIMDVIDGAAANTEYRAWATANGVNADDWMRKSTRILMLGQRYSVIQQSGTMDIDAQIAQIEAQRDAYGDEVTDEIIASSRAMGVYFDALEAIGTPTSVETALLESNWPRLVTAMDMEGDGEDEWGDDERGYEGEYGAESVDIALPDHALPFDPMATSFTEYFHGASYAVKWSATETVNFFLNSTDRHCRIEDESEMAQDEGTMMIRTLYCLTHPGELEQGDDVLAVTIMDASPQMIRELYGRRETSWTAFSIDRWIEEY